MKSFPIYPFANADELIASLPPDHDVLARLIENPLAAHVVIAGIHPLHEAQTLRGAFAAAGGEKPRMAVLCDMNGEGPGGWPFADEVAGLLGRAILMVQPKPDDATDVLVDWALRSAIILGRVLVIVAPETVGETWATLSPNGALWLDNRRARWFRMEAPR